MDGIAMASVRGSPRLKGRLRPNFLRKRQISARSSCPISKNCRNPKNGFHLRHHCTRNHHGNQQHHHQHHDSKPDKNFKLICNGKFTREVYHAICGRLGHTPHIPGDSVQALFNDMHLYPSKNEVSEMLQCARQVGRRNGASSYMTFGEFCFFAREMQKPKLKRPQQQQQQQQPYKNKCTGSCEVFLGGSCNPTTWRTDTAIPELQKHGITYYNPQVSIWAPELVAQEHDAKQSASLLLYVLDSQTRSVSGMIEAAYLVASGRCVVLVACSYKEGQSIMDEPLTNREYTDLANAQTSLLALVKSQGVRVHSNLPSALQSTANILRNSSKNNGLTADEQVTHKLRKLREAFDSFDTDRTGEINLMDVLDAYRKLTNRSIDMRSLCSYLSTNAKDANDMRISFEQFCALIAEFSSDGCDTFAATDDWINRPFTNNNTNYEGIQKPYSADRNLIDVYLGGSCSTKLSWREEVVPLLKKQGVTYYNPAIREFECESTCGDSVCESRVLQWKRAIDKSSVLLFYVTNDTRSLTTMILAAHYIGLDRNVVLCIEQLPMDDLEIDGEKPTKQAIKDYNRGRVYLHDLAKRKQVPVFEGITEAVTAAMERIRNR